MEIPFMIRAIVFIINAVSFGLVVMFFDKIGEIIARFIVATEWYFLPVHYLVAYILASYVLPKIGGWIYQNVAGNDE